MEPTVRRPPLPDGEPVRARATRISRSGRRRRPSGEAPPLPRPLTTGTYWLAATGVVLLLWFVALANSATNNYILSFDLTLLDWVSQLRTLLLTDVMRGVHALGSLLTVRVLFWSTVAVLLRRLPPAPRLGRRESRFRRRIGSDAEHDQPGGQDKRSGRCP